MVSYVGLELGTVPPRWAATVVIAAILNTSKLYASAIEESQMITDPLGLLSPFRLPNHTAPTADNSDHHQEAVTTEQRASCDAQAQQWQALTKGYELVATLHKHGTWSAVMKWDAHRYQWVKEGEQVASEGVRVSSIAEGTVLLTRNVWKGDCITRSIGYSLRTRTQP